MAEVDHLQLARQSRRLMKKRLLSSRGGIKLRSLLLAVAIGTLIIAITDRVSRKAHLEVGERRIVGLLERIARYQDLFRAAAVVDEDGDGNGEYGFLQQIGGLEPVAGLPTGVWQPTLNKGAMYDLAVAVSEGEGIARLPGFRLTLYLHGEDESTREASPLPALPGEREDVRQRERRFSVYAWPEKWNETGRHVYVLTEEGAILRIDAGHQIEGDRTPAPDAYPARPLRVADQQNSERDNWRFVGRPELW